LDLDQSLVELVCYGPGRIESPLAPRRVLQGNVEAVREDQVRDLLAMLEQGVEGVNPPLKKLPVPGAGGLPSRAPATTTTRSNLSWV
jgi:hypothetical protein